MGRIPDILLVGAQKCGTTSLHRALAIHPDVEEAVSPEDGRAVKELHFFDTNWERGVAWYVSHYRGSRRRAIDSTPNYLNLLVAHERMQRTAPAAKILISLRDPIARCYSQFVHYKQDLPRSLPWDWLLPQSDFAANVRAELETEMTPPLRGLLARGYYIDQIEHLLRFLPREQLHIMIVERWSASPGPSLAKLAEFLELGPAPDPWTIAIEHQRTADAPPMDPAIRSSLYELYRPYNERLFELLGYEIEEWSPDHPNRAK